MTKDLFGILVTVSVNVGECKCCECNVGKYLDYGNCKCRKKFVDKLVDECTENIDEVKINRMALFEHENECVCSYTIFVVLTVIVLTINIGIGAYFVYFRWYLKKDVTRHKELGVKESFNYQATIY